jgi:hypothetical protein
MRTAEATQTRRLQACEKAAVSDDLICARILPGGLSGYRLRLAKGANRNSLVTPGNGAVPEDRL